MTRCKSNEVICESNDSEQRTTGPDTIVAALTQPQPRDGELLIPVRASGVTPTELLWYPTTHTKEGRTRTSAVPGHEFSGVIAALGKGVNDFNVGDEIYGMNDWFVDGATAEFCLTQPRNIAPKPKSLTDELAATVPIGALTAWQGLFDRAKMQSGERVLIHGAAGTVGLFAVQLAHLQGAYVIATASADNTEFVKHLGADEVIDYKTLTPRSVTPLSNLSRRCCPGRGSRIVTDERLAVEDSPRREESQSDQVEHDLGQRPKAVCNGAENR